MPVRPLSTTELLQLKIARWQFTEVRNKAHHKSPFLWPLGIIGAAAGLAWLIPDWFPGMVVIIGLTIWFGYLNVRSIRQNSHNAATAIMDVDELLVKGTVSLQRYSVTKALAFPVVEDEPSRLILQLEDDRIIHLIQDYTYLNFITGIPCTTLEILEHPISLDFFGNYLFFSGEPIPVIHFPAKLPFWDVAVLPPVKQPVSGTINSVLTDIEAFLAHDQS